jgi:hypothetical protein
MTVKEFVPVPRPSAVTGGSVLPWLLAATLLGPHNLILVERMAYLPLPEPVLLALYAWEWLILLAYFPLLIVAAFFTARALASRHTHTRRLALVGAAVAVSVIGHRQGESEAILRPLQADAQPVVLALEAYRAAEGQYPPSLVAMVPEHLPLLPDRLRYRRDGIDASAGGYMLWTERPRPLMRSRRAFYWPSGDYPTRGYGGTVRQVGQWAVTR